MEIKKFDTLEFFQIMTILISMSKVTTSSMRLLGEDEFIHGNGWVTQL